MHFDLREILPNGKVVILHSDKIIIEFSGDSCNYCPFMHHNSCWEEVDTWFCKKGYVKETADFSMVRPQICIDNHGK